MTDYSIRPTDDLFIDCINTPLTEAQATYYIREGWNKLFGQYPSNETLGIIWAHSALEAGRWKYLRNNNWGNIKKRDGEQYTSYWCSEVIDNKEIKYYPYNPQTFFRSWPTPLDGAIGYIQFVSGKSRYKIAWSKLEAGLPKEYVVELKTAGYFTAPLNSYLALFLKLYNEFQNKLDILTQWKPEELKPADENKMLTKDIMKPKEVISTTETIFSKIKSIFK